MTILDFRQAPVFQLRADVLLVTLRRTGYGLFVMFVVVVTFWREAQQFLITMANLRTLMEISLPTLLLDLKRRVWCFTLSGKSMCHQK